MKIIDILLQIAIVICGAAGLLLHSGVFEHKYRRDMFFYYTNLSNLWVTLFYLLRLIFMPFGQKGILYSDGMQFAITMSILITFVIFHFIIRPTLQKTPGFDYGKFNNLSNKLVHYAVPLLCVVRWIFFAYKEDLTIANAFTWTIIPFAYVIFSLIHAHYGAYFELDDSRYPYAFMDVDKIGKKRTAIHIVAIWLAFAALGLIVIAFC